MRLFYRKKLILESYFIVFCNFYIYCKYLFLNGIRPSNLSIISATSIISPAYIIYNIYTIYVYMAVGYRFHSYNGSKCSIIISYITTKLSKMRLYYTIIVNYC